MSDELRKFKRELIQCLGSEDSADWSSPSEDAATGAVSALEGLKDCHVSTDLLLQTQLGKLVKKISKQCTVLEVKRAALDCLDVWKAVVAKEASSGSHILTSPTGADASRASEKGKEKALASTKSIDSSKDSPGLRRSDSGNGSRDRGGESYRAGDRGGERERGVERVGERGSDRSGERRGEDRGAGERGRSEGGDGPSARNPEKNPSLPRGSSGDLNRSASMKRGEREGSAGADGNDTRGGKRPREDNQGGGMRTREEEGRRGVEERRGGEGREEKGKQEAKEEPERPKSDVKFRVRHVPLVNNGTRDKVRELLVSSLCLCAGELQDEEMEQAQNLDISDLVVSIETELMNVHGSADLKEYKAKWRSMHFNLKDPKNPDLRRRVLLGDILPSRLVELTPDEMASDAKRAELEKVKRKMMAETVRGSNTQASTDQFRCGKCGQRKTTYFQMQTRSADEPMTTFVNCINCDNRWKFC